MNIHLNHNFLLCGKAEILDLRVCIVVRDGPFDIQGSRGWDISSRQVVLFLFLQNKLFFFKSKVQQVSIFSKNNTLKSEKCKRKQHIE